MKRFAKFTLFTTISTYFLIFVGGLVRVSGAGMGCPDWPTCFGRWIPPTSIDQVPPEMAEQFNMTLAWIEYINRLSGMTVGLFILAVALWAIFKFRNVRGIVWPASLAAVLTAFQGWQGSVVVSSVLQPMVVTVHMLLALLIVSLLVYAWQEAYHRSNNIEPSKSIPAGKRKWIGILWLVGIVQILLGTQVRSAIETIRTEFPNLLPTELLDKVGGLNHMHMTLGMVLLVMTWLIMISFNRYRNSYGKLVGKSFNLATLIVSLQFILGLIFITFDLRSLVQVFHMWFASLYIGIILLIYASLKRYELKE